MKIKIKCISGWTVVNHLCKYTIGITDCEKEPSDNLKKMLCDCEHSPLRGLIFLVEMVGIPSWVSVHFVRHKIGVEHFVQSQRPDRTGSGRNRDEMKQGELVNHCMLINAESIINISRKRLCYCASTETRQIWEAVINELKTVPEGKILSKFCAPDCVYRGGTCHELRPCGNLKRQCDRYSYGLSKYL